MLQVLVPSSDGSGVHELVIALQHILRRTIQIRRRRPCMCVLVWSHSTALLRSFTFCGACVPFHMLCGLGGQFVFGGLVSLPVLHQGSWNLWAMGWRVMVEEALRPNLSNSKPRQLLCCDRAFECGIEF